MNSRSDWTVDPMMEATAIDHRVATRPTSAGRNDAGELGDDSRIDASPPKERRQGSVSDAAAPDYRYQLRHFSSVSIVAILVSAMLLVMVYRYFTLQSLLTETAEANLQVAEATETILAEVLIARETDRTAAVPTIVHEMLHEILRDTNIRRIRILDVSRHVLFSATEGDPVSPDLDAAGESGLANALGGHPDSRMAYRDAFNTLFGLLPTNPGDNIVLTAIPLQKNHRGPVLGIVEIQSDISPMVKRNEKAQILIALTAALVMVVLFASLVASIKRMQRVVEVQHHALQERSDLLAALSAEMLNVQEEEKQRIARDLHERVAQTLAAIKFGIESTSINVRRTDEQASRMLQSLLDPVREAIQEVRQTATELHPASLDDLGLVPTLNWLCRQLAEMRSDLTIERQFVVDQDSIPRELQPILFRIAEEACRIYKSAAAVHRVGVSIRSDRNTVVMQLRDDALPAYADDVPPHPYHRIHDRALLSGGRFSSRTNSWGGVSATIVWDLTQPAARPHW